MKTNQTTTIETRYLRTLLEVNSQEAGLIVQRFARLALGEADERTGDRFLDYIGSEMAECAARIADYREERSDAKAEAGRIGGIRSGEARREKQTKQTKQCFEANEANEALLEANEALLEAETKQTKQTKLNIPNHTEPNHIKSNRTEPNPTRGSGGSGSVDIPSGGSGSGSGSAAAGNVADQRLREVEDADRRAANGEKPLKGDFLRIAPMAVVPATLRLIGEAGNKAMHSRLGKAWRRLGDRAYRDIVYTFAAELEAGEVPDNLGAALNARLTKAEGGAA